MQKKKVKIRAMISLITIILVIMTVFTAGTAIGITVMGTTMFMLVITAGINMAEGYMSIAIMEIMLVIIMIIILVFLLVV